jgi:hypothetical protein
MLDVGDQLDHGEIPASHCIASDSSLKVGGAMIKTFAILRNCKLSRIGLSVVRIDCYHGTGNI